MPVGFKKDLRRCRVGLSWCEPDQNIKEQSNRRRHGKTWSGIRGGINCGSLLEWFDIQAKALPWFWIVFRAPQNYKLDTMSGSSSSKLQSLRSLRNEISQNPWWPVAPLPYSTRKKKILLPPKRSRLNFSMVEILIPSGVEGLMF